MKNGKVDFGLVGIGSGIAGLATSPGEVAQVGMGMALVSVKEIRNTIVQLDTELRMVKDKITAFTITDENSAAAIIETRKQAKDIFGQIERAVDSKIGHVKKLVQDVNAITKFYRDSTGEIVAIADEKIKIYQRDLFIKKQEETRRQQDIIDKENARLAKMAAKKGVEAPPAIPPAPIIPEPTKTLQTASGAKASMVDHWVYHVIDKAKLVTAAAADNSLLKYIEISDAGVKQAIKQNVREIPGLEIVNESYIR